jgi:2-dehydro-3-deoxygluconokinase
MKKIVTFGEIMLRISPQDNGKRLIQTNNFRIEPGGSESNVAIALANLGNDVAFLTRLPDNVLKEIILRYLRQYNIDTSYISIGGSRLGIYWTEHGIGPRASKVIYDREKSSFATLEYNDFNWDEIGKDLHWFHTSGISPAVSETVYSVLKKVMADFKDDINISIDLNYRDTLWNWLKKDRYAINEKMFDLCSTSTLITGNETDFQNALGITSKKNSEDKIGFYHDIAEKTFDKMPKLKYLAVSIRDSISASENIWTGILFYKKNNEIRYSKGVEYRLNNIVDRVGAGDSFTGGIIHGIINNQKDPQKIIDFAVTISGLKHTIKGDASQFSINDVQHALDTKGSGRILR